MPSKITEVVREVDRNVVWADWEDKSLTELEDGSTYEITAYYSVSQVGDCIHMPN
ncbi:hypothetical protein IW142_005229 [Coemansia sp. RSA 564]|nr:hypothetical protein IW142_005229 [Coemansia sp. RSA 564]